MGINNSIITLNGTSNDDWIFGWTENDEIYGKNGNHILDGGSGNDYIEGEEDLIVERVGIYDTKCV